MMIMHEPDKKTRRKWLSEPLLHFSEPADWRGGKGKGGKKRFIFTVGLERVDVACVKDCRLYSPGCAEDPGWFLLREPGCGQGQHCSCPTDCPNTSANTTARACTALHLLIAVCY